MTEDFKAELSEIRKNCKNLNGDDDGGGGEGTKGEQKEKEGERADLEGKLQALTVAYNDIQVGIALRGGGGTVHEGHSQNLWVL